MKKEMGYLAAAAIALAAGLKDVAAFLFLCWVVWGGIEIFYRISSKVSVSTR